MLKITRKRFKLNNYKLLGADKRWKLFQKNYYFEKLEKAAKTRTAISARRSH